MLLFMLGVLLFACMDSITKYLVAHYDVPLVVAIRYIVNCLLMVVLLTPSQGKRLVQTQRTGLVLIRALCLAAASLFIGLAFQRLPIAEATGILFLSPLLVVLVAGPILGERVGALNWVAAIAGFSGILLIAHPGSGIDLLGTVFALCAVVMTAAYQLLSRILASTERTIPMLFYAALIGAIGYGLFMPWSWGGPVPTPIQVLLFLGSGALAGLGHFLFTTAHRDAPASLLAPMMYTQLVWAGLLGWIVFGHVPESMSIIGMCIVAASGTMVAVKSHMSRRMPTEPIE
jgi:drug/metabolite transporter (DMT)-like permease